MPTQTLEMLLEKIYAIIDKLKPEIAKELRKVLAEAMPVILMIQGLTGQLPEEVARFFANMFLHNIVAVLKEAEKEFGKDFDNAATRELSRTFTIKLFSIDDPAWKPTWL